MGDCYQNSQKYPFLKHGRLLPKFPKIPISEKWEMLPKIPKIPNLGIPKKQIWEFLGDFGKKNSRFWEFLGGNLGIYGFFQEFSGILFFVFFSGFLTLKKQDFLGVFGYFQEKTATF